MFKAIIKAETLKSVVYIVSTLVDEAKMTITPEQVTIKAIDPAHIAMLDVAIKAEAFNTYEADEGEIGLDLEKVKAVLKLADGSDEVFLEHDPEQCRLTMRIGVITRRMSLVDTSNMSDPKVPAIDIANHVKLTADVLKKGIKASEDISDHILITIDPEGFDLTCQGDTDFASMRVGSADVIEVDTPSTVKSMYSLEYFSNIVKVIPDKTVVSVCLNDNYPVKLLFSLAEDNINVVYFLAPRIENE